MVNLKAHSHIIIFNDDWNIAQRTIDWPNEVSKTTRCFNEICYCCNKSSSGLRNLNCQHLEDVFKKIFIPVLHRLTHKLTSLQPWSFLEKRKKIIFLARFCPEKNNNEFTNLAWKYVANKIFFTNILIPNLPWFFHDRHLATDFFALKLPENDTLCKINPKEIWC